MPDYKKKYVRLEDPSKDVQNTIRCIYVDEDVDAVPEDPYEEYEEDFEEDFGYEEPSESLSRHLTAAQSRQELQKASSLWSKFDNKFRPVPGVVEELPLGAYVVRKDCNGLYVEKKDIVLDNILELPDSPSEEVVDEIKRFWAREKRYRKYGFLWKRGILLYGPQGSGKTATVQIISKEIVKRGGIVIYGDTAPDFLIEALHVIRRIEKNKPVLLLMEDLDAIIDEYGEPEVLSLLDGELQIDNIVTLATTNYPENLDKRINDRPSRFDLVKHIGLPSQEARRVFISEVNLRFKEALENEEDVADEIEKWVEDTDDFSLAHIKELIILVDMMDVSYEDAIERLRKMRNESLSSTDDKPKIGFNT